MIENVREDSAVAQPEEVALDPEKRRKDWCFTENNPVEEPLDFISSIRDRTDRVQYMIFQLEKSKTGTLHYQGYIELKDPRDLTWIKNQISNRAHWEWRWKTREQARNYCRKEKTKISGPYEYGEWKEKAPGKRTDLIKLREQLASGEMTMKKLTQEGSANYQTIRVAEKFFEYYEVDLRVFVVKQVFWYYGKTGVGKSRRAAQEIVADGRPYFCCRGSKYVNGYNGQPLVLISELRASRYPYVDMLDLTDGYQLKVEIKGSFTIWKPEKIWITAPFHPADTYYMTAAMEGGIEQLLRRITKVECIGEENVRNNSAANLLEDRLNTVDQRYVNNNYM